ncbi:MAG: DUF501 domain-containing protein [Ilumatobacteraceae bacterium]
MSDHDRVRTLLGREPSGKFAVVVRDADGDPVVIRNEPFLHDGTPMPTLYWLCGEEEYVAVSRLEADGAVDRAEAEVDPDELADAHRRYAAERDALIPADREGPRPSGGVAGTRTGVKCLHAHYAWFLAGGDDPVGRWVQNRLDEKIDGASLPDMWQRSTSAPTPPICWCAAPTDRCSNGTSTSHDSAEESTRLDGWPPTPSSELAKYFGSIPIF